MKNIDSSILAASMIAGVAVCGLAGFDPYHGTEYANPSTLADYNTSKFDTNLSTSNAPINQSTSPQGTVTQTTYISGADPIMSNYSLFIYPKNKDGKYSSKPISVGNLQDKHVNTTLKDPYPGLADQIISEDFILATPTVKVPKYSDDQLVAAYDENTHSFASDSLTVSKVTHTFQQNVEDVGLAAAMGAVVGLLAVFARWITRKKLWPAFWRGVILGLGVSAPFSAAAWIIIMSSSF